MDRIKRLKEDRSLMALFGMVFAVLCLLGAPMVASAVETAEDGDWDAKFIALENTPEARLMVRSGDIDNLNFGWPEGFNPFSGESTPVHGYPWTPDPADPSGTDRIMVVTSFNGAPPFGDDGYTDTTSRPDNDVAPIIMEFSKQIEGITIKSAVLQIFVDDFQAPVWGTSYEVRLDGIRVTAFEEVINSLDQTGPIGKLITVQVPFDFLTQLQDGVMSLFIDDTTTGAGDGFAIDFVKLLINPKEIANTGSIAGTVFDAETGAPLEGALVSAAGMVELKTGRDGTYTLADVPAGLVVIQASKQGYSTEVQTIDLLAGQSLTGIDFNLSFHGCNYTVSQIFPFKGGKGYLAVDVPSEECPWTAESNVSWVVITQGHAGAGKGKVVYRVLPNFRNAPRSGQLTITGHIIPVSQEGKPRPK